MQQRKVLVADDDEDMLKLVAARRRANGYQVLAASDGAEALKRATEELSDISRIIDTHNMRGLTERRSHVTVSMLAGLKGA